MSLTVITTTKAEIQIAPALKRRTLQTLRQYADLKAQRDALDRDIDKTKAALDETLDAVGEPSIELDGFKLTRVEGQTYKKVNEAKLVELGCAVAWIREATENHPKKSYLKVTIPGQKEDV